MRLPTQARSLKTQNQTKIQDVIYVQNYNINHIILHCNSQCYETRIKIDLFYISYNSIELIKISHCRVLFIAWC